LQLLAINLLTVADVAVLAWIQDHDVSEFFNCLTSSFGSSEEFDQRQIPEIQDFRFEKDIPILFAGK
jgi:hypothetical protein